MEVIFLLTGFAVVALVVLCIGRVVSSCARTVFAPEPQPTKEDLEKASTRRTLPPAVSGPETAEQIMEQGKQILLDWMRALNNRDTTRLQTSAPALCTALQQEIAQQQTKGERERFEGPKVSDTVISAYDVQTGCLTLSLCAQAVHYTAYGGQIVRGREDLPEQMLWEIDCICGEDGKWQANTIRAIAQDNR